MISNHDCSIFINAQFEEWMNGEMVKIRKNKFKCMWGIELNCQLWKNLAKVQLDYSYSVFCLFELSK